MQKYNIGDKLKKITVTEFSYEGYGVYRDDNVTILIDGALENEVVDIVLTKVNSKIIYADVVNIKKKSSSRLKDINKTIIESGVAPLAIINYSEQLLFKTNVVKTLAERQLNYFDTKDILACEKEWNYRNKVTVFAELKNGMYKFGTYKRNSHKLIEMKQMPLAKNVLNKVLIWLVENFNKFDTKNSRIKNITMKCNEKEDCVQVVFSSYTKTNIDKTFIDVFVSENPEIKSIIQTIENLDNKSDTYGALSKVILGETHIVDSIEDNKFIVEWNAFFQVNPYQTKHLYKTMVSNLNITKNDIVLDAYSGIGTISTFLSKKAKSVYAVEIVEEAGKNGYQSAQMNGIDNIFFYTGNIDEELKNINDIGVVFDIVCVDPPRNGLTKEFIDLISMHKPRGIGYISCNPHTLIRDLKLFKDKGYKIKMIQPVDMFPQTHHIECVAILEKINQ
ncbi:23S rRNA (uracil(1939)-C(5))-methyltransferase RlmD [Mycoplasma phocoenae]|uniref:23S rRNA (Uracil(1939)-C(5))-methyltransferase RlmD n=1 Tax=Mycoplasma phocoenae TaxID=754517 RepID=A0A858U470_9MOLU|nr:23S rRNA (uracil(1939)-C(5))-methyltransferase RlmD [Mycoplasma phocoenae]QJG66821.1 23S rRNA (uracil(1939)-C(5))-methyltransferase RlmD [Mycoplasma phocoenae]